MIFLLFLEFCAMFFFALAYAQEVKKHDSLKQWSHNIMTWYNRDLIRLQEAEREIKVLKEINDLTKDG